MVYKWNDLEWLVDLIMKEDIMIVKETMEWNMVHTTVGKNNFISDWKGKENSWKQPVKFQH